MIHNKRKIFNDPVHGFITIPGELIFDIIEHPFFQRLRRIKQLGLAHLVYPGALHTRFQHAIGSMHLMMQAVEMLRSKNHRITDAEAEDLYLAILLHDIGHGPFSHALELTLVENISHEELSLLFMKRLNEQFGQRLSGAMEIFSGLHHRRFFHQLVSGQLDVDRLDYLMRDSFYTGVSEGVISTSRILKMLNVADDQLAIEYKGIYSIEKFLVARRLMYWQVYLHKTSLAAEYLIVNILRRAKTLATYGILPPSPPSLEIFLANRFGIDDFEQNPELLDHFARLDDVDIYYAVKIWADGSDKVLSSLCRSLLDRRLSRIDIFDTAIDENMLTDLKTEWMRELNLDRDEINYFVYAGVVENLAYSPDFDRINILHRDGRLCDITECSELNVTVLSSKVKKYFICSPKF